MVIEKQQFEIESLFATYEISKLIYTIGFDETCLAYHLMESNKNIELYVSGTYNSGYLPCSTSWLKSMKNITKKYVDAVCAPTYDHIISWFEREHGIYISRYCFYEPTTKKKFINYSVMETTGDKTVTESKPLTQRNNLSLLIKIIKISIKIVG